MISVIAGASAMALFIYMHRYTLRPVMVTGAVIRKDLDPRRQAPIANVKISALDGTIEGNAKSDASGFFKLKVYPLVRNRQVTLEFGHDDYMPFELQAVAANRLYVARMEPLPRVPLAPPDHTDATAKVSLVTNVRLRYALTHQVVSNVGSIVKQFEVVNTGNVPCRGQSPCSPDGKWKAATGSITVDAQKGYEFHNVRASCVAGPCPFTRIEPTDLSLQSHTLNVTALNWSDTASFIVEAEVTRTTITDMNLQSYPFISGQTMSFDVPAAAEGTTIIADINKEEIVFPLGPKVILSWTTCSIEIGRGGNKLYRCEINPGYKVQQ